MVTELIQQISAAQPKAMLAFVIIASLAIMIKSADMLLYGITRYARRLGLSDYIIGLVVVAIVASFPELVSSITGASLGDAGIVFGTILGSNIGGLTLVMGIMAIVGKKLNIESKLFKNVRMVVLGMTILPILLVADGVLSRIDGGILIATYAAYLIFLWRKEKKLGRIEKSVKFRRIWKDGLIFLLALGALLLSASSLIFGVIELSRRLNISSFIISSVIVGIGAQAPDLIVIIRSELSGHKDVGMGDLLGSTLTKGLLFLGIIALVTPLTIPFDTILISALALTSAMALVLVLMREGWVTWKEGLGMLGIYMIYLILQVFLGAT